ncbi:translation initiation factor IF-2 [Patescibacteria group bacterium]|nr:translation initiation factor IF-2 [Patescibacteria group bacterium]
MTKEKKKSKNLQTRPPVVVVLGHVDHGKSSILEKIKDLKITEKESGGITQHIGAYEVEHQGKKITFIDTPGHEAFSAMRSRGAKVADIAILVIAAEEGIKPQTKEAISHIKKAKIPMIVAINKMDKPGADPEKVKRELSVQDILVESMGGKIPSVETSAETGKGISDLLELILLVAEMEDFKADVSKLAEGVIVESYLDPQRGPTATLILQNGILKKGDILGTSSVVGKIRIMEDFQGKAIEKAFPSMPVVVLGFESVPGVGERLKVFANIEAAKKEFTKKELGSLKGTEFLKEDKRVLNIILKVDVLGSVEAIEEVLKDLPQEKVVLKALKAEVGEINESDVKLAIGSKAKIIGFRVKADSIVQSLAEREKIKIACFEVIYELAQGVRDLLEKRVSSEVVRVDLGKVKILEIFLREKNRQIIGGKVIDGEARRGASIEVYRNEEKVGQGKIAKLQKEKKEIGEVGKGSECGILYQGDTKIEEGDILHIYIKESRKGEL